MNILFILSSHHYLYLNNFFKISSVLRKKGHHTFALARLVSNDLKIKRKLEENIGRVAYYGEAYYTNEGRRKVGYIKSKIDLISSINHLKQEIKSVLDSFKIDRVIVSDSYDLSINIITKYRPYILVYYIQNSAQIFSLKNTTIRQKYINIITYVFCGIKINRLSKYPPFNNKNIFYILWSKVWSNNVKSSKYKIKYLPKIKSSKNLFIKKSKSKIKIKKILIVLNKKTNIGLNNWLAFTNFYLEIVNFCDKIEFTFKIHPNDDLKKSKSYLKDQTVLKEELELKSFDLVLSHWSTLIYESAESGVPFILVNPKNRFDYKKWRLESYPLVISNKDQFIDYVKDFEEGKIDYQKILNDLISTNLGVEKINSISGIESIIA